MYQLSEAKACGSTMRVVTESALEDLTLWPPAVLVRSPPTECVSSKSAIPVVRQKAYPALTNHDGHRK